MVLNKQETKVLTTKDYGIFKRINGNRIVDARHVKSLKEAMFRSDLKIPIIVNENMEVIDGQHRIEARKQLNFQVYYIKIDGLGIRETQVANANNKNWGGLDFLNFYVEENYYNYKVLRDFMKKYKFGMWESMLLLGEAGLRSKAFNNGEFYVSNIEFGNDAAEKIYKVGEFYKGFKRRSFVFAMVKLLKNKDFDFNEFIQKVSYQSQKMVDCTKSDHYLLLIEGIYNYKRKDEDRVRFL